MSDTEGFIDGCALGWVEGCTVGQSDVEGFCEGWLLGAVVLDGDPDGSDVGQLDSVGAPLGCLLG